MSEFVIVNNKEYECVTSSELHYLFFTFTGKTVDEVKQIFDGVTELKITDEDKVVRGNYENLKLISVEEVVGTPLDTEGTVTSSVIAKLYIKTQIEVDVDTLKITQDEQDSIIADLVFGLEEI